MGQSKQFAAYQDAKSDLIGRLGSFCAYCEAHLGAGAAVEHIEPKSQATHRARDWDNLLLSCSNCNSTKGIQHPLSLDVYLPDRDNTARAFQYGEGGLVSPHSALGPEQQARARRTLKLFGLDKTPANDPRARDRRWLNRLEVWGIARESLADWREQRGNPRLRNLIVALAKANGHWSIWMAVFEAEPEMRRAFIDAFPGTCRTCFDTNTQPVHRPGGSL
jgi:uncharacterized protein (TIGR02646 family)